MRRWDRLLELYVEEYRARGVSPQSVGYTQARLDRWGRWLKGRRPRIAIERIDAELITRYIANCSSFRAKATVYATLRTMRGFGDYLVRVGAISNMLAPSKENHSGHAAPPSIQVLICFAVSSRERGGRVLPSPGFQPQPTRSS
jgi:hypothetical protein